jgi:hypothetical protein
MSNARYGKETSIKSPAICVPDRTILFDNTFYYRTPAGFYSFTKKEIRHENNME